MNITRFAAGILAMMLIACGRSEPPVPDPFAAAEQALRPFLDRALNEFTHELGSTEKRWESPFVTQELLLLVDMEFYRAGAFSEGISYGRKEKEIPQLRLPGPRSFWLPINAEGTYTYSITQRDRQHDIILLTVQFNCTYGTETNSDQTVIYHMSFERGSWKVAEITKGKDYSLKRYLTRKEFMDFS